MACSLLYKAMMNPSGSKPTRKSPPEKPCQGSKASRRTAKVPRKSSADANGKYEDLCSSCEKRESCSYPRPVGGVWHCEGYC